MIYAIDFDGTLCVDKYPEIGAPKMHIIEHVKELKKQGNQIILWTCRNFDSLDRAVAWCKNYGLEFDAVNDNLKSLQEKYGGNTRKVFCDYYIDDRNICLESIK